MKKSKTFAKVVYWLFTIMMGVLMCVFLPYIFLYDGESMNMMEDYLEQGKPADAMAFVGGYYKSEPIFAQDFSNGGSIVLFESATLYEYIYGEGEDAQAKYRLHKAYSGFVYGVDGLYNTIQETGNKTVLKIQSANGEVDFEILNTDNNGDGAKDGISTLYTNGFFFLEMGLEQLQELQVTSISTLKFIDKDGNIFSEIVLPEEYFGEGKIFTSQFFADIDGAIKKYNEIIDCEVYNSEDEDYDARVQALAQEMSTLDAQIIEKGYAKSTTSIARSRADKLATITIVCYFVGIIILGDFLVGGRFILKFFTWILVKVFKVDPEKLKLKRKAKNQQAEADDVTFGNDYFCQVTFQFDDTQKAELDDQIVISYASETQSTIFTLNKANGYKDLQRVRKDVLKLTAVESLNSCTYDEIPDLLVVEGFNKSVTIKNMMQEE